MLKESQLDMFNTKLFPEFYQAERIRLLEEQQSKLRKGLFRRWTEQEKKIKELENNLNNVILLLEKEPTRESECRNSTIYPCTKVA